MKKKMDVFFTALLLISFTIQAQAPSVLWVKEYGGSDWCYGESVAQTDDGGFIVAGHKEVFKTAKEIQSDGWRVYVVRTGSNGDTLWTREYGGEDLDQAYSIQNIKGDGFIIAGKTRSFGAGNDDLYIIRIDINGDTLWTKAYGTKENDAACSVDLTKDGGFILAGETSFIDPPGRSVYLVRTDSTGDTLWTKTLAFEGDTVSCAYSIMQTNDGGFALAGWITGAGRGLFMRTDSSGKILVKKVFALLSLNTQSVFLRDLKQTSDGGFILVGQISRPAGFDPGVLLVRTDPDGDTLWTKVYTEGQRGYSVDITEDDGFIVSSSSGEDTFIIRTDSNGDSLWAINSRDFEWNGWLKSIKQTADGGYIATGQGHADSNSRQYKLIIVRLDKDGSSIQKEKSGHPGTMEGFTLVGNFMDNVIYANYTIPSSCNVKLEVYDTQGRLMHVLVDKYLEKGSHTVKWRTWRYRRKLNAGGVYFLRLSANGHTVSKKINIVK